MVMNNDILKEQIEAIERLELEKLRELDRITAYKEALQHAAAIFLSKTTLYRENNEQKHPQ